MNIRASSLSDLFDCPARWASKYIDKKFIPTSAAAFLGTCVHAGSAFYDERKRLDDPVSIDAAKEHIFETLNSDEAKEIDFSDRSKSDVETISMDLTEFYCKHISDSYVYAAVEAKCEDVLIADLDITLTGTTDRIYMKDDAYGIADIKTGSKIVSTDGRVNVKGHAAQIAVYQLLAQISLGYEITLPANIIGLQTAKTSRGQRSGIGVISTPLDILIGDENNRGLLAHAAEIIKAGSFYGNPKSSLCGAKYCPNFTTCRWRR